MMPRMAGFKFAAICCCFLALAACSKKNTPDLEAGTGGIGQARPGSEQDFATNVGDRIYFIVDQSDLTPEGQEILTKQAQWLQRYPNVVVQVEGHSDERGTREYNIALGERRGKSVADYLAMQGVSSSQLEVVSFGEERPAVDGAGESAYSKNRRVEIIKK